MTAVLAWVRGDLRGRVRSVVALALLVALASGVVLTAVAGARRGDTAMDRLLEQTKPATVAVLPNEAGFDWDAVAALPEVTSIARFPLSVYAVEGIGDDEAFSFAWLDDDIMRDIEAPVVLDGRRLDPSRADEVVVTREFETTYGRGVGDTVEITLLAPEQVDEYYLTGTESAPAGPRVHATIVGVVRSLWFSDVGTTSTGVLIPSPGLFRAHPDSFLGTQKVAHINALVRLAGGAAAVPTFREHLAEVSGRRDIDFLDLTSDAQHIEDVANFEADALLVFGLAALVAAVFLVGQSVVRFVSASMPDRRTLLAVGMSRREVDLAASCGPALAAVLGASLGAFGAFAASSRFPIGTAEPLEPSPGRQADLTVLIAALVIVPLLVTTGALLASRRASRSASAASNRRTRVNELSARTGAPVPVAVGTSFALDPGRGAQAIPVLPAVVGSVVGVLGVVAALTFAQGVNDATGHPERFGQVADLQAFFGFNGEDFLPGSEIAAVLARDPDVVAVNDTRQGVAESGTVDVPVFTIDPVGEPLPIVATEGRRPAGRDEITLGPESAHALDVGVGDTVELVGSRSTRSFTVSGIAFVPEGPHNEYDSGAWVHADAFEDLIDGFKFHTAEFQVRDGADLDVVTARLGRSVAAAMDLSPDEADEVAAGVVQPLRAPIRLVELRQIRRLPLFLAGFLALLAVAAVGHALATAVRRRRHDLAVLRALGLTRRQSRIVVVVQAMVLAMVGLGLGTPLGFALGRTLWRSVAGSTPVLYVPPVVVGLLVLIAPAVVLGALALAAWPSQRAASIRVGNVLRTE